MTRMPECPIIRRMRARKPINNIPAQKPIKAGKRGAVVIPVHLRRRYGIEEGTLVVAEPVGEIEASGVRLIVEQRLEHRVGEIAVDRGDDGGELGVAVAQVLEDPQQGVVGERLDHLPRGVAAV